MYSLNKKQYKWDDHANDFPSFVKAKDAITFAKADYRSLKAAKLRKARYNSKRKIVYHIMKEQDNGFGNIPTHLHVSNVECIRGGCKHFKLK